MGIWRLDPLIFPTPLVAGRKIPFPWGFQKLSVLRSSSPLPALCRNSGLHEVHPGLSLPGFPALSVGRAESVSHWSQFFKNNFKMLFGFLFSNGFLSPVGLHVVV